MNHTFKESLPESNSITEAVCCACSTLTIQVKRNVGSMYGMESQHVQTCFKTCPNLFLKHVQTCSYIVSLTAILLLVAFFPWETSGFAIPLWWVKRAWCGTMVDFGNFVQKSKSQFWPYEPNFYFNIQNLKFSHFQTIWASIHFRIFKTKKILWVPESRFDS